MNARSTRRIAVHAMLAGALALAAGATTAQVAAFPSKPVRILMPFAPGGTSDVMTRQIAERLGKMWQQPVIVENKVGASGIVAADAAAKSEADGHTVLMTVTAFVQAPALYGKASYDPVKDFAPVSQVGTMPLAFVVNPSVPAKTLAEFIELAKAKPGTMAYGSFGTGSAGHLYMEILKDAAKVDLMHVPYKGEAPEVTDLIGMQIPSAIISVPGAKRYAAAGKLRPLAVTGSSRAPQLPDVPTFAEAGYRDPGLQSIGWYGMLLPAKTPREVVEKFSRDLNKVLADPELRKRMLDYGISLTGTTPDAFAAIIRSDQARWTEVIHDKKIKAD